MIDAKTIAVYDDQVAQYASTIKQAPSDKILLDFIAHFKVGDYVLDLGCGPAQAAAIMRDHGLRVDPTDASAAMVDLANQTFAINARQATFHDITENAVYQGIWANFSLLHASREELPALFTKLHRALYPQGVFHLAMKIGTGSQRDKLGRMYTYYSQAELCQLLADNHFHVAHIAEGEALGLAGELEPWIAISSIAQPK